MRELYFRTMVKSVLSGIIFCLLTSTTVLGQGVANGFGSWNIGNIRVQANERWSIFVEPQIRSLQFYNQFHYYEVKGGATYRINEQLALTASIGSYQTFSEGGNFEKPQLQDEVRSWFQVAMRNQMGRVRIEHRYRLEQRFTQAGYRNRFRYRLQLITPINSMNIAPNTWYLVAWNELFLTDAEPHFERNRIFGGIGYEVSQSLAIQTGYIHQYDYKLTDEIGRDFLQVSVLLQFDLKKLNKEFIPGTVN